ncbi:hypothetical protein EDB92DRAFT_1949992 [Lactarius akahatsu]|uniref:Uncharacterized protein n=1 Tax=Lactarius akahatsu TaxID=416441 RepID=A0AAD4LFM3_9AGAM|nr:hypothetical protein EDB92DRAFT_1949992 [Lactarius akahatsu]
MRKLARVANIIVNVSKMYGKHNLNEEDLPPSPLAILGSLQIPESWRRSNAFWRGAPRKKGFKGLLRRDLLKKIKQCDGELSKVL